LDVTIESKGLCRLPVSDALVQMVDRTQKEAIKELGISLTVFKNILLRPWGIQRWPGRHCISLKKCIADVEECRARVPQQEADNLLHRLQ
jgi:hypothetical protein